METFVCGPRDAQHRFRVFVRDLATATDDDENRVGCGDREGWRDEGDAAAENRTQQQQQQHGDRCLGTVQRSSATLVLPDGF